MALPIDDLITPLTKAQVEATILDLLVAVGIPATSWSKKGTARTIIGVLAVIIAGFTVLMAAAIRGTILKYATSVWLTVLAKYVYGVERTAATFASTNVTLINAGGGDYSWGPGELIVQNSTTGKTYQNTALVALGPLSSTTAAVRAIEVGAASSASAGEIDTLVTTALGVTCTNVSAAIGQDEQSDDELRQDCEDARGALSPFGTRAAYSYFAKHVPGGAALTRADGTAIGVNRVQPVATAGTVAVYVATASGDVAGSATTPGDDLYLVAQSIYEHAAPLGVTVTTDNATVVDVVALYAVYANVNSGRTEAEIKNAVDDALTGWSATYPIGGLTINGTDYYMFLSKLRGIIASADEAIVKVELTLPVVDQILSPGERAHISIANGSTVTLVDPE